MTQPEPMPLVFDPVAQDDWSSRLTWSIAREVRRHRDRLDMSAEKLSQACAELGVPIPRTVLANLESGRRPSITVAELVILATVLQVPVIQLIAPAGFVDEIEALPEVEIATIEAVRWLRGTRTLDFPPQRPAMFEALTLYVQAEEDLERYADLARNPAAGDPGWVDSMGARLEQIRATRAAIRRLGLNPPPLPREYQNLDAAPSLGRRSPDGEDT